ncbi:uncharacterized protein LOC130612226 [Hydractinia symbiolongicarpus]|uniref:uncharacterized protein LOC130612226 n=1 Tax=Hydractinia symbiolongicarpus TaxID=13093 RepID=UPI00254DF0AC|nr:uncharacterized protein LOC130612226 [Hydractinia symbiolongicarpus]
MYFYNTTTMEFHFYLSTNQKWMGFGQKSGTGEKMLGLRGVYCSAVGTNATVSFFEATAPVGKPSIFNSTSEITGVKVMQTGVNNGVTFCYITTKKNVMDINNVVVHSFIDNQINAIAYGDVEPASTGEPTQTHTAAKFLGMVEWMRFRSPKPSVDLSLFTLQNCNSKVGCLRVDDCNDITMCKGIAMYYYNRTTMKLHFYLSTNQKWMGFGQKMGGVDTKMTGLRGVYCSAVGANAKVSIFEATEPTTKPSIFILASDISGVEGVHTGINNGITFCYFTTRESITDNNNLVVHNFTDSQINAIAYGNDNTAATGEPQTQHTGRKFLGMAKWMKFPIKDDGGEKTDNGGKTAAAVAMKGSYVLLLSFVLTLVATFRCH